MQKKTWNVDESFERQVTAYRAERREMGGIAGKRTLQKVAYYGAALGLLLVGIIMLARKKSAS